MHYHLPPATHLHTGCEYFFLTKLVILAGPWEEEGEREKLQGLGL
jgi:hypothetical protein